MEDQSPRPGDLDPTSSEPTGELKVPHEQYYELDESTKEARNIEKWQFRKAWERFFGDIANLVEVKTDDGQLLKIEEIAGQPIEKQYELSQEVKDTTTSMPAQGASSVGSVMTEALNQKWANITPQLAATESLHRTLQQQQTSLIQSQSLYKKAVIAGLISGILIASILVAINLSKY